MRNIDTDRQDDLPARGDGGTWKDHMLAVAQLRALGKQWPECAEATGLTPGTCRNYPSRYPGWDALVDHYRQKAFDDGVRDHFLAGSVEALDALRCEFRDAADRLSKMEQRAADGELDPEEASAAVDLSRAVAYAADKYLSAIGFQRYRERVAEMEAEEATQGKIGQTHHVEGVGSASELLDNLDDMDTEDKTAAFKDLVGDGRS